MPAHARLGRAEELDEVLVELRGAARRERAVLRARAVLGRQPRGRRDPLAAERLVQLHKAAVGVGGMAGVSRCRAWCGRGAGAGAGGVA